MSLKSRFCHKSMISSMLFYPASIACLLFLSSCGGANPSVSRTHKTDVPSTRPVLLLDMHLFDAQTGWSLSYSQSGNSRVLHTTTGVMCWQDVTPAFDISNFVIGSTDFLDAKTAWIVGADPNVVYRTFDGGQAWQKTQLPGPGKVEQITFLDAHIGWIVLGKGAGGGNLAVDVLHTSDGGATWKTISRSNAYNEHNPKSLPFQDDKGGLSFVNEMTGWMSGFTNRSKLQSWFYVTHDGGVTWGHQAIPLPIRDSFEVTTFPPVFFTSENGLLPVTTNDATGQATDVYVTRDGGKSWSATTPVPTYADVNFVDMQHGWMVTNTFEVTSNRYKESTIYRTNDGGKHWVIHKLKLGGTITALDFVSLLQGWILDSEHKFYQTEDGGENWKAVSAIVDAV